MLSKKPLRIGIYVRLSLSTEESVSIERQIEACQAEAERRGGVVVVIKSDDGVSATRYAPDKRPGWQELLEHDLDVIIVWKIDRLARRALDFLQVHKALEARGIALVAVVDKFDMGTSAGRAMATVGAVFAEMEAASMSERTKASTAFRVRQNRAAGGPVIWTHHNVKENGVLVTRPTAQGREGVYKAMEILLDGGTLAQVSHAWRAITGKAYDTKTVRTTLTNPMIAGGINYQRKPLLDDDGVMVIDKDRAILSVSDWKELCEAVKARAIKRTRYAEDPVLLDGLLLCGTCEGTMGRINSVDRGAPRYKCRWRKQSTGALGPDWTPITTGVQMHCVFWFPRPTSHFRTGKFAGQLKESAPVHHIKQPDRDKLDRAVMDALTQSGLWRDDAQCWEALTTKAWTQGAPGTRIDLTWLS